MLSREPSEKAQVQLRTVSQTFGRLFGMVIVGCIAMFPWNSADAVVLASCTYFCEVNRLSN